MGSEAVAQEVPKHGVLPQMDDRFAFLATRAAIELDNRIIGVDNDMGVVEELATILREATGQLPDRATPNQLVDPSTVGMLARAFEASQKHLTTLNAVLSEASEVTAGLHAASSAEEGEDLARIRDFCVALSLAATSWNRVQHSSLRRPQHLR